MCLLDASKAYDQVNHRKVFEKLANRSVSYYFIRILSHWYMTQTILIRWGDDISIGFGTTNRLRQGGVISSYLNNFYINDLTGILNWQKIGCMSGKMIINNLMYADDLILISPSANGLRSLMNVCEKYATAHDIVYNSKKSNILISRNVNCKKLSYNIDVN